MILNLKAILYMEGDERHIKFVDKTSVGHSSVGGVSRGDPLTVKPTILNSVR